MKKFFNTYFSKNQLERYWLAATLISALSILYWILYQYNTLSYNELSFFSWTQSINDWVKILPITLVIFISWFIWYGILDFIFKIFKKITNKWWYHILFAIILVGLMSYIWQYIDINKAIFKGNLAWTLYIWILWILIIISITLIIYPLWCLYDKFLSNHWILDISTWLNNNKYLIFILIIALTFLNSIWFIYTYPESLDKHNCFIHEWKIYQLKYMNDRYIFTNVYIDEKKKEKWPFYVQVFENKNISFPLWFWSCSDLSKSNAHYIKKDWECIEVLSYDNDYQYFETNKWLLKNNWYDLYLSGNCISDLITKSVK